MLLRSCEGDIRHKKCCIYYIDRVSAYKTVKLSIPWQLNHRCRKHLQTRPSKWQLKLLWLMNCNKKWNKWINDYIKFHGAESCTGKLKCEVLTLLNESYRGAGWSPTPPSLSGCMIKFLRPSGKTKLLRIRDIYTLEHDRRCKILFLSPAFKAA